MSGISGGRGRHAASHAKPGKLSSTKAKVTTTAAVTGAIAFTGGVAEAVHIRSGQLQQQAQADAAAGGTAGTALAGSRADSTASDQTLSQLLQQRGAAAGAVNRDLNRRSVGSANTYMDASAPVLTTATAPTPTSLAPLTAPGSAAALAGLTGASGVPTMTPPTSGATTVATPTPTATTAPTTPAPTTTATPAPKPTTTAPVTHPVGWNATPAQAKALAEEIVPVSQFACFDAIITRESSWNVHATNPTSGAYGLPQALPGDKMASVSSDWRNNAVTQIKWGLNYMDGRYGSPCAAWTFWQAHGWY